jgi:hypothetical protein
LNRRDDLDKQLKDKDYTEGVTETNRHKRDMNRIVAVLVTMVERYPGKLTRATALNRLGRDRERFNRDDVMTALLATNKVELINDKLQLRR